MNSSVANRYRSDGMASTPPGRILTMLYDRMLLDFDRAIDAIGRRSVEEAHGALVHAQEIVFELQMALDVTVWPEGRALNDIYTYLLEQLTLANTRKSVEIITICRDIVAPLGESWHDALRQTSAPTTSLSEGLSA